MKVTLFVENANVTGKIHGFDMINHDIVHLAKNARSSDVNDLDFEGFYLSCYPVATRNHIAYVKGDRVESQPLTVDQIMEDIPISRSVEDIEFRKLLTTGDPFAIVTCADKDRKIEHRYYVKINDKVTMFFVVRDDEARFSVLNFEKGIVNRSEVTHYTGHINFNSSVWCNHVMTKARLIKSFEPFVNKAHMTYHGKAWIYGGKILVCKEQITGEWYYAYRTGEDVIVGTLNEEQTSKFKANVPRINGVYMQLNDVTAECRSYLKSVGLHYGRTTREGNQYFQGIYRDVIKRNTLCALALKHDEIGCHAVTVNNHFISYVLFWNMNGGNPRLHWDEGKLAAMDKFIHDTWEDADRAIQRTLRQTSTNTLLTVAADINWRHYLESKGN